jgi:hypothetical protein
MLVTLIWWWNFRVLQRRRLGEEGAGVGARQAAPGLLRPRHGSSRLRRLPRGRRAAPPRGRRARPRQSAAACLFPARSLPAARSAPSWRLARARGSGSSCAPGEGRGSAKERERKGWGPPVGARGQWFCRQNHRRGRTTWEALPLRVF